MLVSIGYASNMLGVCRKTLRRWDKAGELVPMRNAGGHRRYNLEGLKEFMQTGIYTQEIKHTTEKAAIYARVLITD